MTLEEQLIIHEGMRTHPYRDMVGKLTIGVGRNLTDVGLREDEIRYLLQNDVASCRSDVKTFDWWAGLDPVRQRVLIDMRFNLGPTRFRGFRAMLRAVSAGDYAQAATQMRASKWATQVGARADRLARWMETGVDDL